MLLADGVVLGVVEENVHAQGRYIDPGREGSSQLAVVVEQGVHVGLLIDEEDDDLVVFPRQKLQKGPDAVGAHARGVLYDHGAVFQLGNGVPEGSRRRLPSRGLGDLAHQGLVVLPVAGDHLPGLLEGPGAFVAGNDHISGIGIQVHILQGDLLLAAGLPFPVGPHRRHEYPAARQSLGIASRRNGGGIFRQIDGGRIAVVCHHEVVRQISCLPALSEGFPDFLRVPGPGAGRSLALGLLPPSVPYGRTRCLQDPVSGRPAGALFVLLLDPPPFAQDLVPFQAGRGRRPVGICGKIRFSFRTFAQPPHGFPLCLSGEHITVAGRLPWPVGSEDLFFLSFFRILFARLCLLPRRRFPFQGRDLSGLAVRNGPVPDAAPGPRALLPFFGLRVPGIIQLLVQIQLFQALGDGLLHIFIGEDPLIQGGYVDTMVRVFQLRSGG